LEKTLEHWKLAGPQQLTLKISGTAVETFTETYRSVPRIIDENGHTWKHMLSSVALAM
jgi:hypothetical protein